MNARAWLRLLAVIGLAVTLRGALSSREPRAVEAEPLPASVPATADQPRAMGTSSCSGRACHGSLEPMGNELVRRNEYTKWLLHDKHAQAYLVLWGERSQTIAKNLGLKAAHTAEQCLACHQYPTASALVNRNRESEEIGFGVGCEACHGGAKNWLESHTQKLSPQQKADAGMIDVGQPGQLAKTCVGCHVGSPAVPGFPGVRDVNHDLIAAGHPRLNFEFAAYLINVPPHWNEAKKTRSPEAASPTWAVGQAITAKAALELLVHRASPAKADARQLPWPELAEYDCFACHHDLQATSWRQEATHVSRPPGLLRPSVWYYTMPRMLAQRDAPDLVKALDDLDGLLRVPYPNASRVADTAQKASQQIDTPLLQKLASLRTDAKSLALAYRKDLENGPRAATNANWDAASQLYLALAALQEGRRDPAIDAVIRELITKLAFPADKEPKERYDSPKDYQPKRIQEILKALGD